MEQIGSEFLFMPKPLNHLGPVTQQMQTGHILMPYFKTRCDTRFLATHTKFKAIYDVKS